MLIQTELEISRCRCYGIHSRSDTNRIGVEDVSFLIPKAAVLPGSDVGINNVEPASTFFFQNRQTLFFK